MIKRILYSCSCISELIKLVAKKQEKCLASLKLYLFSPTHLTNSMKHDHSFKILYIINRTDALVQGITSWINNPTSVIMF